MRLQIYEFYIKYRKIVEQKWKKTSTSKLYEHYFRATVFSELFREKVFKNAQI